MKLDQLFKNKNLNYLKQFKKKFFLNYQKYLTRLHYKQCPEYNLL